MLSSPRIMIKNLLNRYPEWVCKREFKSQTFRRFNERPVEFAFVFRHLAAICPATILDVGTGTTALPHLMRNCGCVVTAADNVRDYWPSGIVNRHYHVINDDITSTRLAGPFDLITCVSVLEHIQTPDDAVRNMFSLLKPGGHLILTFPYNESNYVKNVYELPGSSYAKNGKKVHHITQSYSRREFDRWLKQTQGEILEQEYWQLWEGEHWTVGKPVVPGRKVSSKDRHQLTCVLMTKPDTERDDGGQSRAGA